MNNSSASQVTIRIPRGSQSFSPPLRTFSHRWLLSGTFLSAPGERHSRESDCRCGLEPPLQISLNAPWHQALGSLWWLPMWPAKRFLEVPGCKFSWKTGLSINIFKLLFFVCKSLEQLLYILPQAIWWTGKKFLWDPGEAQKEYWPRGEEGHQPAKAGLSIENREYQLLHTGIAFD